MEIYIAQFFLYLLTNTFNNIGIPFFFVAEITVKFWKKYKNKWR